MLESIRLCGSKTQQRMAENHLRLDGRFREKRESMAEPGVEPCPTLAADARKPSPRREVFDGQMKASLPGKLIRDESSGRSGDKEVDQAFVGAGHVHKLYRDVYLRDSLDGMGMRIISTVHHRRNYANAFWDGTQMAYGDGDGQLFLPMTNSLSVIGHELSHGIVQFSGGLIYQDQSGALNESFADVFGALSVQFARKQNVSDASWLVGDGLFTNAVNGDGLRSLKRPGNAYDDPVLGKDPQPYHMDFYVVTANDNGGVHINSGIPNHAFYLYAQYLGGFAWEKAGNVWYQALQELANPHATFFDWALQTLKTAEQLFGSGSREANYLRCAWRLVGIGL